MDYEDRIAAESSASSNVFRGFVFVSLVFLLASQLYAYAARRGGGLEGDFSDIKYVVMQLTAGLTEVNRKHERLQSEMERVSTALPAVAAAAGRAKDALGPRGDAQRALDVDYDRQIADYALESAGARVLDTGDTVGHVIYESPVSWALHALTSLMCRECQRARVIIQPGALPGQCWAFKGSTGEATIRLLGTIKVTGFSVEHIPAHIDPTREILSAPRLVQLEGLRARSDPAPYSFGTYEYARDGSPVQYFEVAHPQARGFGAVRVRVLSNWGHPVYTCVYRVRVHGELLPGQAPVLANARNTLEDELHIDNE